MSKELKIDENSYLLLLNKVLKNKEEERDMALDRYRKADESIQSNDHFMLLGKNAVSFLRLASDTTNDLANLAKEIKSIVFKESDNNAVASAGQSADQMRAIIDLAREANNEEIEEPGSPSTPDAEPES
jgi:hypothetical protein